MNEPFWLEGVNPLPMLHLAERFVGERKLRLFAAGCCRLVWETLLDPNCRAAVEAAECYADGEITEVELRSAYRKTRPRSAEERGAKYAASIPNASTPFDRATDVVCFTGGSSPRMAGPAQCDLLRDIVGNPFHSVWFRPHWRTVDVTTLAGIIYRDRQYDLFPILGDALIDAGCDDGHVLSHCRSEGPHVRGCWVIDAILGKE